MYLNPDQTSLERLATPPEEAVPVQRRRAFDLLAGLRLPRVAGRSGPIGLDLTQEHLNLVQFDAVDGQALLRAVAAVPLPQERETLLADPRGFARLLREARGAGAFRGRQVVTCMPPTLVRLSMVSYRYKGEGSDAQAVAGDQVGHHHVLGAEAGGLNDAPGVGRSCLAQQRQAVGQALLEALDGAGVQVDRIHIEAPCWLKSAHRSRSSVNSSSACCPSH